MISWWSELCGPRVVVELPKMFQWLGCVKWRRLVVSPFDTNGEELAEVVHFSPQHPLQTVKKIEKAESLLSRFHCRSWISL
eukprot:g56650.t1